MRVKTFSEFITEELRKVISDKSGTGKTKSSVVMTHSTGGGNIDNDIYAIAIWSIN